MSIFKIKIKKNLLTRLDKTKDLFIFKLTFCELCVRLGIYCFYNGESALRLWLSRGISFIGMVLYNSIYDFAGEKYYSGLKYL